MSDSTYSVQVRPASKNGWFTPDEARAYYGLYSRDYYIVHWWGSPGQVGNFNATVDYILRTAAAGNMSVNYVLSNEAIAMLVYLTNVSWGAQGGNPVGINVEHEPTLNDEGYKKSGWLKEQCEQVLGKRLGIKRHADFFATACPGSISLDRIEQECDKWRRGIYDQPALPIPPPQPPVLEPSLVVLDDTDKLMYTLANAKLVNFDGLSVIKSFPLDTPMEVSQKVRYNNLEFYRTVSATNQNRLQGFLVGDLKDGLTPPPTQPEPPKPVDPVKPEWERNLRDLDDTEYWLKEDAALIDIKTGQAIKHFAKDESFVSSALTMADGVEYRITDYSFKKGIFNGIPISKLTLTPPGVPDIKPVPDFEQRLSTLESLIRKIVEFLANLGFKK